MGRGRLPGLALVLALTLAGCTYADREPGLFGRESSRPTTTPSAIATSEASNPDLPVVGDAVWTGDGVQIRIAVHAVRRIPHATVLDYSFTPLVEGHVPGAQVPSNLDLGLLSSGAGDPQVFLLEPRQAKLYRPLTGGVAKAAECLCTSITQVQPKLRYGRTTILQAVYPALPARVTTIDVTAATVAPFANVPVTPEGMVPLASGSTDLSRPAPPIEPVGRAGTFRTAAGQTFDLTVDQAYASRTFTALVWTVRARTSGPGLRRAAEPPLREYGVANLAAGPSAGGVTITPNGRPQPVLRSRLATSGLQVRCLCTDFGSPESLTRAGGQVNAVTVLPALAQGTSAVDVQFPSAGGVEGVRVTTSSDGAFRSAGPVRRPVAVWAEPGGPLVGWPTSAWPTPVPGPRSVARFTPVVSDLIR